MVRRWPLVALAGALAEHHAALFDVAVFDAARHGVACELPELALDAVEWPAFDDCEPEIRPKR